MNKISSSSALTAYPGVSIAHHKKASSDGNIQPSSYANAESKISHGTNKNAVGQKQQQSSHETFSSAYDDLDLEKKKTLFQFDDWFESLQDSEESNHERELQKLEDHLEECEELLSRVDSVLDHLNHLKESYEYSSSKTDSLYESCENLLQQQQGLIVATERINETMAYFNELETMSKKLGTPSHLILNESLVPTLTRLDECILFMESKANYKESPIYLVHFKHILSQALNTIRTHVVSSIQQTTKSVMPEAGSALSPGDDVFTLFYGKFQANCHRIKSLMALIEERLDRNPNFVTYLDDCHEAYFKSRESLMGPVLSAAIEDMVASSGTNYCDLMRNSSRMLMHICRDEYHLYFQFFTHVTKSLEDFSESLCLKLYNVLRPIVIHINSRDVLNELCQMIRDEVLEDVVSSYSQELRSFGLIMERLDEDMQERLAWINLRD